MTMRLVLAFVLGLLAATAQAQPWPAKPVRIVVGFAPGGGNDFIARFIAQRLSGALAQQFIVENRPGAGGSVGVEMALRSPPDGHTLALISNSYTVNPSLFPLRFDPLADMAPIIQISQGPYLVVVHPSVPARSLQDLLALLRTKPDAVFFASSGTGSVGHLATELFASMAGFKLNHVPYKGTGPALADTIAGHAGALLGSTASTLPHVRAGKLRALAVTTLKRLPAEPDLPTIAEAGVPGFETILWHGLIGPRGLPVPVIERLHREITAILKLKETADLLQNDGVAPAAGGSPSEFHAAIAREIGVWKKVVATAGVKAE